MSVLDVVALILAILAVLLGIFLSILLDVPRNLYIFFKLSSYMRDLEVETKYLRAKKEDINQIIAEEGRKSRRGGSQVKVWMEDVDGIMPEIQTLVDYHRSRCRHYRGISSICSNYLVGMECADKLERLRDLLKRGCFDPLTVESNSPLPIPASYQVPGSLEPTHAQPLESYVQNDKPANVIGIWGMGDVEKATLMR